MSNYITPSTLSGPPTLFHGVWYSYGAGILPRGPMLSLNSFWSKSFTIAIGGLIGWAISILWRIGCAVLFTVFYADQLTWEESQNMVLIVNSRSALDAFMTSGPLLLQRQKIRASPQRRKARKTLFITGIVALIITCVNLGYSSVFALIPTFNYGLAVPHSCGNGPLDVTLPNGKFLSKQAKWANAAFAILDGNKESGESDTASSASVLPTIKPFYSSTCPTDTTVCNPVHPFNYSSSYTLLPQHFSLNTKTSFSLQVTDSCFRAVAAAAPLPQPPNINATATPIGLYYGPLQLSSNQTQPYTFMIFEEAEYGYGYYVNSVWSMASDNSSNIQWWTPNATLLRGGDTTMLFYVVASVAMAGESKDPIFATSVPDASLWLEESFVASVLCDTKYVLCAEGGSDCSSPEGLEGLLKWISDTRGESQDWSEIAAMLVGALQYPPIAQASVGSSAVAASLTTLGGEQNYAPENATALNELTRLTSAGMMLVASYMQLSAVGFWDLGNGTEPFLKTGSDSLCNGILVKSVDIQTFPVVPNAILIVLVVLVILMGKFGRVFLSRFTSIYRNTREAWALHLPGQLHREVAERIRGDFGDVDTEAEWPTVDTYHLGPAVISRKNMKRFGSATDVEQKTVHPSSLARPSSENRPLYPPSTPNLEGQDAKSPYWSPTTNTSKASFNSSDVDINELQVRPLSYNANISRNESHFSYKV